MFCFIRHYVRKLDIKKCNRLLHIAPTIRFFFVRHPEHYIMGIAFGGIFGQAGTPNRPASRPGGAVSTTATAHTGAFG